MRAGEKLPGRDTLMVLCSQTWYLGDTPSYRTGKFAENIKGLIGTALGREENIILFPDTSNRGFGPIRPDIQELVAGRDNVVTLDEPNIRFNRGILTHVKGVDATVRIIGMNATTWVLDVAKYLLEGRIKPSIVLDAVLNRYGGASAWTMARENEIPKVLDKYAEA